MSFLDNLKNQMAGAQGSAGLGGLLAMAAGNPQVISALTSLLSTRDTSVGGGGGLGGLITAFQQNGLGNVISQWVATGPNPPISPEQVNNVLGQDTVKQFADKAGVPAPQASSMLANLLPAAVDHLTPDGKVPDVNTVESTLSSLLGQLGGR